MSVFLLACVSERPIAHFDKAGIFGLANNCCKDSVVIIVKPRSVSPSGSVSSVMIDGVPSWGYQYAEVDRLFLILSPVLFTIFNSVYWSYFYLWDR